MVVLHFGRLGNPKVAGTRTLLQDQYHEPRHGRIFIVADAYIIYVDDRLAGRPCHKLDLRHNYIGVLLESRSVCIGVGVYRRIRTNLRYPYVVNNRLRLIRMVAPVSL